MVAIQYDTDSNSTWLWGRKFGFARPYCWMILRYRRVSPWRTMELRKPLMPIRLYRLPYFNKLLTRNTGNDGRNRWQKVNYPYILEKNAWTISKSDTSARDWISKLHLPKPISRQSWCTRTRHRWSLCLHWSAERQGRCGKTSSNSQCSAGSVCEPWRAGSIRHHSFDLSGSCYSDRFRK